MSKDGAERTISKEVTVKTDAIEPGKSIQEQLYETRQAVEDARTEREKPRTDFLLGKGGKASDHFDVTTNREFQERMTDQTGAPESTDSLSESAREHWLRTGELPKKKVNGEAAPKKEAQAVEAPQRPKTADFVKDGEIDHERYEKALDDYETKKADFDKAQADAKNAEPKNDEPQLTKEQTEQLDMEVRGEAERETETWFTEPAHAEAMKTFPERWQAMEASLTPEQKATVEFSRKAIGQIVSPELNRFALNALARTKNMAAVYVELLREPALLWRMQEDWARSANWQKDPAALKLRISTDKTIRYMIKLFDKRAASASNGAKPIVKLTANEKPVRTLTQAGRPPAEAQGGGSSPADDGSSEAAWRRKDLSQEARGELYRERKNQEESEARRRRHPRRAR